MLVSCDAFLLSPEHVKCHICTQGKEHCTSWVCTAPVLGQQCTVHKALPAAGTLLWHLLPAWGCCSRAGSHVTAGCDIPLAVGRDSGHILREENSSSACPGSGEQSTEQDGAVRKGLPQMHSRCCPCLRCSCCNPTQQLGWPLQSGMVQAA